MAAAAAWTPGIVPRNPNADQIAAQVVPLRQTMQGLASEELLGDLALERTLCDRCCLAMGLLPKTGIPVNSELPTCPAPGAHST